MLDIFKNEKATEKFETTTPFKLYPNPADEWVHISYDVSGKNNGVLKIFDLVGKEVMAIECAKYTKHIIFSVADILTGLYTYKFFVDEKLYGNGKLIIR